ncbi:hypothetical protein [Rhodococcoides kyotonense]|uniref:Uncharacterized protein n=1 Tax=Rhodococcoides kyotonense TaxID=398843 RepID=A0A239K469_9NOCA|nr:hypothetical protein [Rhodococcus kyotonensis]SNT12945.1 hypothetical protein SAMN05421642_109246 [Rhodococcus kyotonensis]
MQNTLKPLAVRLSDNKSRSKVSRVGSWAFIIRTEWFHAALHNKHPERRTDKEAIAGENKLLDLLKDEIPMVKEIIRILNDKDRDGSDRGYVGH